MIESETFRSEYNGNGATDTFAYTFPVQNKSHILVTLVAADDTETTLTVDTDYTVNGVGSDDSADWDITLTTAPATGQRLVIVPNLPLLQSTDLNNQGGFYPDNIEEALDYLTIVAQQQQEQIDRSVKVSVGSESSADTLISDLAAEVAAAEASATAAAGSASDASDYADAAQASAAAAATFDPSSYLSKAGNLSGLADAPTARGNLGLGDAATKTVGTSAGNVVALDGSAKLPAVDGSQLINVSAGKFTLEYVSAEQTITVGGSLTLAHGLGVVPKFVQAVLKCTSAELNYSVNDLLYLPLWWYAATYSMGTAVVADSTNLNVRFGSTSPCYYVLDKTTGGGTGINTSKWKLILKAWA